MSVSQVDLLIAGERRVSRATQFGELRNPSTGGLLAQVPMCSANEVDEAVSSARAAFPGWAATPVVERARILLRYRETLSRHAEELARLVTREHGKTLSESRASVQRGLEMVEFACGWPGLSMGQVLPNAASGIDCQTTPTPVGVCVGITPFNFPVMTPLWMFPLSIVCGNTFVLKPSEKAPLSAVRLGELFTESGLPPGVFNVVHGARECVEALLVHASVDAVSFVGSTESAKNVHRMGTSHGKRVQAAGGAKNHMIVMPDADLDQAIAAVKASAFGCAGERCMAGSVAVVVGRMGAPFLERLSQAARTMRVGPTSSDRAEETFEDGGVEMGPLVTKAQLERTRGYLEVGAKEGAHVVVDGREWRFEGGGYLIGPSVLDHVDPEMRVAREEIFGPVLSMIRVENLEQALRIGEQCPYGNGASIFTRDGWAAREFAQRFNAGMIGINVGVPAPMAWFPFSGWNQSFFGDLRMQGVEGAKFYTRPKTVLTRWFEPCAPGGDARDDPLWKGRF